MEVENQIRGRLSEETKSWLIWAKQKADWFDPLINSEDQLLTENDKQNIIK